MAKKLNLVIQISVLILLGQALIGTVKGQDTSNVYCCTQGGMEYHCESGYSCCDCIACCGSGEFCSSALSTCIPYTLIIISPITLALFLVTCVFNYWHKRKTMNDQESLRILEEKGDETQSNEAKSDKSKLQNLNDDQVTNRNVNTSSYENSNQDEIEVERVESREGIVLHFESKVEEGNETLYQPLIIQNNDNADETYVPQNINIPN